VGYDLHITRAEFWVLNEGYEIPVEEWLSIVEQDPELVLDPPSGICFAYWQADYSPEDAWFDWFEGNIFAKSPDRATVGKMLQIASWLGAQVQGDEGEIYLSPEDWPEDEPY
jgi:hypothetical protein